jgi:hypothetical protein
MPSCCVPEMATRASVGLVDGMHPLLSVLRVEPAGQVPQPGLPRKEYCPAPHALQFIVEAPVRNQVLSVVFRVSVMVGPKKPGTQAQVKVVPVKGTGGLTALGKVGRTGAARADTSAAVRARL